MPTITRSKTKKRQSDDENSTRGLLKESKMPHPETIRSPKVKIVPKILLEPLIKNPNEDVGERVIQASHYEVVAKSIGGNQANNSDLNSAKGFLKDSKFFKDASRLKMPTKKVVPTVLVKDEKKRSAMKRPQTKATVKGIATVALEFEKSERRVCKVLPKSPAKGRNIYKAARKADTKEERRREQPDSPKSGLSDMNTRPEPRPRFNRLRRFKITDANNNPHLCTRFLILMAVWFCLITAAMVALVVPPMQSMEEFKLKELYVFMKWHLRDADDI